MWVLSNAYDGLTIVHYLERMWPNFMGIVVLWNGHCSVFQVEIIHVAFKWLIVLRSYENMWSNAPSPCHLKCAATTKCMLNPSGVKAACRVTEHGHPKRAELLGVNINTGVLSITTEEASLTNWCSCVPVRASIRSKTQWTQTKPISDKKQMLDVQEAIINLSV